MENQSLLGLIYSMIASSTKDPKYAVLSSAKIAQLTNNTYEEVEQTIEQYVESGQLVRSRLEEPPYYDIYMAP